MRWFRIRKANIDSDLRNAFEQYGPNVMQLNLALGHYIKYNDKEILMRDVAAPLSQWLTEQYDKDERKQTWSLTMEFAIVILVAAELAFSILRVLH